MKLLIVSLPKIHFTISFTSFPSPPSSHKAEKPQTRKERNLLQSSLDKTLILNFIRFYISILVLLKKHFKILLEIFFLKGHKSIFYLKIFVNREIFSVLLKSENRFSIYLFIFSKKKHKCPSILIFL